VKLVWCVVGSSSKMAELGIAADVIRSLMSSSLLLCDAMHSVAIAVTRCLFVCLSVRHVRELHQNE